VTSACVWVRPPLLARVVLRMALVDWVGTRSVAPGEKPDIPASPSWPNRLKLVAMTVLPAWLNNSGGASPAPCAAVLPEINVRLRVRVPWLLTPPALKRPKLPEIVVWVRVKFPSFCTAPVPAKFPEMVLLVTVTVPRLNKPPPPCWAELLAMVLLVMVPPKLSMPPPLPAPFPVMVLLVRVRAP